MAESLGVIKAPFPWFGGKSRVASLVWDRFGDVRNYVEPFAGSLAVLLGRPHAAHTETVNDLDCYLANFWRALAADPDGVAAWCDWPVNEADLHARHNWLVDQAAFRKQMHAEADFYDVKVAGWWVWGLCQWIGDGWCIHNDWQQLPHLGTAGMGVHRPSQQLPHLGDAGRGVHRPSQKLPHLGDAGMGDDTLRPFLYALAARLRRVRVACGDWSRVLGGSVTWRHGVTGVFLDPPYDEDGHAITYAAHRSVSRDVREWALANSDNPKLRIALCGYAGDHDMPGWDCVPWKARGGYGSQGSGRGRENAARERIWFSPHCLRPESPPGLGL